MLGGKSKFAPSGWGDTNVAPLCSFDVALSPSYEVRSDAGKCHWIVVECSSFCLDIIFITVKYFI